ncbi:thiamine-phosphate diphosphorylase [Candidatus Desantisbacteria bacterium CG2_30_40_21]|uniref:Thiamine-phosphate synthase n=5 Tax=unclassified Candidatus Desantisiibacteriota TaxID=3106372 RepID=A0A2M7J9R2_9BACT|nr:MAG: thiamine-phosphate diphosphorylase [Candidatus Desantisbacteria bacterium CG2_30_40_21]PIP39690.1 MAG: thiamine phosphate synthase [Candidatus Desantisbacteria bacterium CG23_combo_of_CG06-09_8_20_14_all_40_23]PIX16113.1 MAG: thiamine phosphate synthase [Candidatus Desantisbacteria bacterium CG_4_8_14_3_um_filter_40_12]PIY20521.1 MAG: thiamine phosphate synthase [Candidatus Desantisbacteria bacterium CG_4_10_14_3_um_filter_40_18]PJB28069.1 MAG: thiamine phosphate synthase [Candidatus De
MDTGILRIIDANFNRVREGLRVVEELVRFEMNSKELSERLKGIRHSIAGLINESFGSSLLISARDSQNDVGLAIHIDTEDYRTGKAGIIKANIKRAQEAIRVLEEFVKLYSIETSRKLKALRYQAYSLEQEVLQIVGEKKRIHGLYLILDYGLFGERIWDRDCVKEIITAGVDVVQLRVKGEAQRDGEEEKDIVWQQVENIPDGKLIMLGNMLREITEEAAVLFIINDRLDIALAVRADGVHLGQDDMPVDVARKLMGDKIIGISTHSLIQAQQAEKSGADYIGIGPVYSTTTKRDVGKPIGCEIVHEICKTVSLPVVAIGGINQDNLTEAIKTGAGGIAVANAILKTDDPAAVTKKIAGALHNMPSIC